MNNVIDINAGLNPSVFKQVADKKPICYIHSYKHESTYVAVALDKDNDAVYGTLVKSTDRFDSIKTSTTLAEFAGYVVLTRMEVLSCE